MAQKLEPPRSTVVRYQDTRSALASLVDRGANGADVELFFNTHVADLIKSREQHLIEAMVLARRGSGPAAAFTPSESRLLRARPQTAILRQQVQALRDRADDAEKRLREGAERVRRSDLQMDFMRSQLDRCV